MRIAFWRMALPWWFLCGCIVAHDTASFAVWLLIKPQVQAARCCAFGAGFLRRMLCSIYYYNIKCDEVVKKEAILSNLRKYFSIRVFLLLINEYFYLIEQPPSANPDRFALGGLYCAMYSV